SRHRSLASGTRPGPIPVGCDSRTDGPPRMGFGVSSQTLDEDEDGDI
ncbi:MAG: hypothetical protein QOE66_96, partial [Chloroflexota bacterium]|nr:hypothetical protein [Chloroflexota bacterium]